MFVVRRVAPQPVAQLPRSKSRWVLHVAGVLRDLQEKNYFEVRKLPSVYELGMQAFRDHVIINDSSYQVRPHGRRYDRRTELVLTYRPVTARRARIRF